MNNSERDIIARIIKGDKKAYNIIVERHYKELFTYAMSLSNNYDASQDIIQNVLIKVWEYRDKIDIKQSIRALLYKSVYNEFINFYHKQNAITALEKSYHEILNSFVESDHYTTHMEMKITCLKKEIENLPNKCQEVFSLSKKEGLSNQEIADFLKISLKTVEGQITKAYTIIKKNCLSII